MFRAWRLWLICLLALALPLQGHAASGMAACGEAGSAVAAAGDFAGDAMDARAVPAEPAADHDHNPSPDAASNVHTHADADADAVADPAHPHDHDHDTDHAGSSRCSACASCCSGAALISAPLVLGSASLPVFDHSEPLLPALQFQRGGQDRPPRPGLA
ncbi:MAG: hypothetical protein AB9M60_10205 [Leptothrix sp. (in: b-proteobacteria)]